MIKSVSKSARTSRTAQKASLIAKNRRPASVDTQFRGSYVPETRRSVSEERKFTHLRYSGSRKSSFNDGKRVIKDTRPLHDRAYQKRKINDLIAFLEDSECNLPLTAAKLMSPSKKEFETIFQFLYNLWDPSYVICKIEEEAPKILKNLCYPFSVNKSAFMYVARTNWPVLLGVLIWMMDLNKFAFNSDVQSIVEGGNSTAGKPILFRYISQCYYTGNDNETGCDEIFAQIVRSEFPANLEALEKESEERDIQLKKVEDEIKELDALEKEDADLKVQIQSYEVYFFEMKKHIEMKKYDVEQLKEKLNIKKLELNRLLDEIRQKQDAYEAQGFDGRKHLNYLETQKKEQIEKLEKKNAELRKLQDECWETDIQHTEIIEKISQVCDTFNELYAKVSEMGKNVLALAQKINNPIAQKLCEENHLHFPEIKMRPSEYSRGTVCQEHQNTLEKIEKNVKKLTNYVRSISSAQNDKLHEMQTSNAKLSRELKLLSAQITENECEIRSLEKQNSEEMASLESECDKQMKILENLKSECDVKEKNCKDLRDELKVVQNLRRSKETELEKFLKKRELVYLKWKNEVEKTKKLSEKCQEEILEKIQRLSKK